MNIDGNRLGVRFHAWRLDCTSIGKRRILKLTHGVIDGERVLVDKKNVEGVVIAIE
jgi:hypothetical protein